MPQELPYLPTYKNVGLLFEKIHSAKIPESFTQKYLQNTLGIKGSADRPLITLMKALGFIDNAGKPTGRYASLKNEKVAAIEIGRSVREAYEPLFAANELVYKLEGSDLKGVVAQVAGSDTQMTTKIVGTFKALVAISDFESNPPLKEVATPEVSIRETHNTDAKEAEQISTSAVAFKGLRPEFNYNIQVHLPSNGSEETYMNIFNAVRKVFK